MSHAVKYRATCKAIAGTDSETTFVIELLEDGFVGDVTDVEGDGEAFKLTYDKINARNPTESPIQKARLEFYLHVQNSSDLSIVTDLIGADEDQYQLRLKQDGNVLWTGYVLTDLIRYSEGQYPFRATIVAKDLTRLSGIDFDDGSGGFVDDRVTLITTLADFLDDLGLGLDIYTYTSWITSATTDTDDFLNQIYNERRAFRRYGRTGDESDEKITLEEALERFLRNYGLILRQEDNAWRVYQITELEDPTSVLEAHYNSSGTQQSTSTVDLTVDIDRVNRYLMPASVNIINPGIKEVTNKFNHRSKVQGIQFEDNFELDSSTTTKSYSQFFLSDGNQQIEIEGLVEGYFSSGHDDVTADIRIKIIRSGSADYFWDGDSWTTTGSTISVDLTNTGRSSGLGTLHLGGFRELTSATPSDADGTLEVTFLRADSAGSGFADTTIYRNATFDILNEVASENSTSILYKLTQSGGFSTNFEIQETWFGDGPTGYAGSALRSGGADGDFTVDVWQRRGTTSGYRNFHENLLKEIIDTQRGPRRNLQAELWGNYSSANVVSYDSKYFFFMGGSLTGRNVWDAQLLEVNIVTAADTFQDLPKFTDETGSGTGSSGGGSSGGLDQSTADARYLKLDASNDPVSGGIIFDIGTDEFRIRDGSAMFVVDGATGQIGLGAEPLDDVGLLLDTPARAVTDNTDYDRLKVTNSGALTIAASTTSPIVATAQFDEPNINLASGAAVTNAATVYIEDAPTEGDDNWALYAPSGATGLDSLFINGSEFVDSSRNVSAVDGTFSGDAKFEGGDTRFYSTESSKNDWRLSINTNDAEVTRLYNFDEGASTFHSIEIGGTSSFNTGLLIDGSGDVDLFSTLTINSQLLFTLGNEQLLSTDATPIFNGGTFNGSVTISLGSSGGTLRGDPLRIERDGNNFIHMLRPDANTVGLLFGNATSQITSAIIDDSSVLNFRSGGNNTALRLDTSQNAVFEGSITAKGLLKADSGNLETTSGQTSLIARYTDIYIGKAGAGGRFNADANLIFNADDNGSGSGGVFFKIDNNNYIQLQNDGTFDVDTISNFQGDITTQSDIADDGFSDWFSVNPAGYRIKGPEGEGDFRTILTDELIAKAFTADVAQALAGSDFLTKSVSKLAEDFVVPAVSSTVTITVEDLEGLSDLQVFEANDWVRFRVVDRSGGGLAIFDVWGQVTSYVDNADDTQDWTFTVDYAGPSDAAVGRTIYKGALALDYGQSGDTYIERTVLDRSSGSDFTKVPYDRVVKWTGSDPRTGTKEVLAQKGNINGLAGFSSATYGFFAKDNFVVELDGGNMKFGKNVGTSSEDGIHIDSDDYWYTNGKGSVGNGILDWDASAGEVNLAGFTATTDKLSADFGTSGQVRMSTESTKVIGITRTGGFGSSDNYVRMFAFDDDNWGMQGRDSGGNLIFRLGDTNQIAGIDFDDSALSTGDGSIGSYTAGTVTGLQKRSSDSTRVFFGGADDNSGTNANFYVRADGKIFYDGIGKVLYSANAVASFSTDASTPSLTNEEWETEANASIASVTDTDEQDKVEVRFIKRYGEDNVVLSGWADIDGTGGGSSTREGRIYLKAYDDSGTLQTEDYVVVGSTGNTFTLTLDISSLSDDTYYTIVVNCWATVTSDSSGGATCQTQLREDIFLFTTD